jgi:hypothetical protein
MIHRGQIFVNPSSTIIISHTSLHALNGLVLENLLVIKLLP